MDKNLLDKFLALMSSSHDSDSLMGLRGAQKLCQSEGVTLENMLRFAAGHLDQCRTRTDQTIDHEPAAETTSASAPVNLSGVPECRVPRGGVLEVVLAGNTTGEVYPLPGESAKYAQDIALHLKDAIVAAVINKSRFKFKLNDVKNAQGVVVETALQAEYERAGMAAIRIWSHTRGEVGALATVLRKIVANTMPELAAA